MQPSAFDSIRNEGIHANGTGSLFLRAIELDSNSTKEKTEKKKGPSIWTTPFVFLRAEEGT